ncbi:MAG TPA: Crp/Fnr family transcriptional regulator [Rubrivivax sp.]|nr:Crp/Fnr family transcriptional regulator [Rubrivivax sp.]
MALAQNHLIEHLPRADRQRLLARCEPVALVLGEVLCERGDPVRHAYFPLDAVISLVMQIENHPSLEVGMVGREGMVGAPLILDVSMMPLRAVVQATGTAWRVSGADFQRELAQGAALRRVIQRFMYVRVAQMASAAACLRFHLIGPRLARWLLMSQDRAQAAHFHVTHEFLACMLGVRRVGITAAAGALQRAGLIAYHRGELRVLDRTGLERAACSCYAADTAAYRQQLGSTAQLSANERRPSRA